MASKPKTKADEPEDQVTDPATVAPPAVTDPTPDESDPTAQEAKGEPVSSDVKGDTTEAPEDRIRAVSVQDVKDARTTEEPSVAARLPQMFQHPSLTTADEGVAIEIAERTIDLDTTSEVAGDPDADGGDEPTTQHVKDFVTLKRDWDAEDHDAVHERNMRAVRQYMVNQGMRPDAKVVFMGETVGDPVRYREDLASVTLRYGVEAVPAVVAVGMEQVHTVIDQNQPTAVTVAENEAGRIDRIRAGNAAKVV